MATRFLPHVSLGRATQAAVLVQRMVRRRVAERQSDGEWQWLQQARVAGWPTLRSRALPEVAEMIESAAEAALRKEELRQRTAAPALKGVASTLHEGLQTAGAPLPFDASVADDDSKVWQPEHRRKAGDRFGKAEPPLGIGTLESAEALPSSTLLEGTVAHVQIMPSAFVDTSLEQQTKASLMHARLPSGQQGHQAARRDTFQSEGRSSDGELLASSMNRAAVLIQSHGRRAVAARSAASERSLLKEQAARLARQSSASAIQRRYRMRYRRHAEQEEPVEPEQTMTPFLCAPDIRAATLLQTHESSLQGRMHQLQALKSSQQQQLHDAAAARRIQRRVREGREVHLRKSALRIQSHWRGSAERRVTRGLAVMQCNAIDRAEDGALSAITSKEFARIAGQQRAALQHRKQLAVRLEEYQVAGELKALIAAFDDELACLDVFEARKEQAVVLEDYDNALRIKRQKDSVRMRVAALLFARSSEHPVSTSAPAFLARGPSNDAVEHEASMLSTPNAVLTSGVPTPRDPAVNEVARATSNESEWPHTAERKPTALIPVDRKPSCTEGPEQLLQERQQPKGIPPWARPSALVFGEQVALQFASESPVLRRAALRQVLNQLGSVSLLSQRRVALQAIGSMLSRCFSDKSAAVVCDALFVFRSVLHSTLAMSAASDLARFAQRLLPSLVRRAADIDEHVNLTAGALRHRQMPRTLGSWGATDVDGNGAEAAAGALQWLAQMPIVGGSRLTPIVLLVDPAFSAEAVVVRHVQLLDLLLRTVGASPATEDPRPVPLGPAAKFVCALHERGLCKMRDAAREIAVTLRDHLTSSSAGPKLLSLLRSGCPALLTYLEEEQPSMIHKPQDTHFHIAHLHRRVAALRAGESRIQGRCVELRTQNQRRRERLKMRVGAGAAGTSASTTHRALVMELARLANQRTHVDARIRHLRKQSATMKPRDLLTLDRAHQLLGESENRCQQAALSARSVLTDAAQLRSEVEHLRQQERSLVLNIASARDELEQQRSLASELSRRLAS